MGSQFNLPPNRGDIPTLTRAEADIRFIYIEGLSELDRVAANTLFEDTTQLLEFHGWDSNQGGPTTNLALSHRDTCSLIRRHRIGHSQF